MTNNTQKTYTADEYKELVEKIAHGEATQDEIKAVELMVSKGVEEIDSILKENE